MGLIEHKMENAMETTIATISLEYRMPWKLQYIVLRSCEISSILRACTPLPVHKALRPSCENRLCLATGGMQQKDIPELGVPGLCSLGEVQV